MKTMLISQIFVSVCIVLCSIPSFAIAKTYHHGRAMTGMVLQMLYHEVGHGYVDTYLGAGRRRSR